MIEYSAVDMKVDVQQSGFSLPQHLLLASLFLTTWCGGVGDPAFAQSSPDGDSTTTAEESYQTPDTESPFFSADDVTLERFDRLNLVAWLAVLAVDESSPLTIKTKALGLALRLDPVFRPAFTTNLKLKQGQELPPATDAHPELATILANLFHLAKSTRKLESETDDNLILAMHVMDLVITMDPANVDCAYELALLAKHDKVVDWSPVIGDQRDTPASMIGGTSSGSGNELGRMQALVKGLLVKPLEASQFAGKASQMNATATPVDTGRELKIGFNQKVGSSMISALGEVVKYLRVRHKKLPSNCTIEIAFEEQYIPKDGPSAAVACALMLESLISDIELDTRFAVTGDLNADGTVQPVGGVTGKLRGAAARDCSVVAVPDANRRVISDLLIMDGPKALTKIQIFSLQTFDQALELAKRHDQRSENVRKSIEEFERVQEVLNRPNGMNMLKNSHVQGKLRECVKLTPNHLSARHLLLIALGRSEKHLSLQGSLQYIDRAADPLLRVLRQGDFQQRTAFDQDEFADSATALRRIRSRLDPRTTDISDRIVDFSGLVRTFANDRPVSANGLGDLIDKIRAAGKAVGNAYDKLESSVDYQEEVMK